jgi:tetratricopeptide (TPR) repeat protein
MTNRRKGQQTTLYRKKKDNLSRDERKENALRPSRYLGYDHDSLGLHLLSREAYEIAIHCFRRAVWLNPFEPEFRKHMALCLYKLDRYAEAAELLSKRTDNEKDDKDKQVLLDLIERKLKK